MILAMASSSSPKSGAWVEMVYVVTFIAILATACIRIADPFVTRRERFAVVIIATCLLYGAKLVREPVNFIDHDTILHWVTAQNMILEQRLFTPNPLLPVSPLYPGVELTVTALSQLTGLSIFAASVLITFAARIAFVMALYLIYEQLTKSSLVAAIGVLVYASNSSFFIFNVSFSYETLAVSLMAVATLRAARMARD